MTVSSKSVHARSGKGSSPHPANRLAGETSPYLLQHAHNPVDWYPWGEVALRRAREENKPIFLSIGYSSCHWCHVMERESFEDPETAEILNASFVAVKVDREERPDLDEIYMTAVQLMTGRGGWPLSVFLTPDLKPFYGGTYFPPDDHHGMPSFRKVLGAVSRAWRERPDQVAEAADRMVRALQANAAPQAAGSGSLDTAVLVRAARELQQAFDPQWGGFGDAPKFPPSSAVALLLRQEKGDRSDLCEAPGTDRRLVGPSRQIGPVPFFPMQMVTVTLDRMACGGLYDQIGGGFHRYSVDAQWLVPHFEKMLYDNALLGKLYLEAWQATGRDLYRRVATGIFDYVLRDMTDPRGGFHAAEDADSEGEEGKFYVWTPDQIKAVLGDAEGAFFCDYYGVTPEGNFEGRNILYVPQEPAAFARSKRISEDELEARFGPLRRKLLAARSKRVRPGKDDKVLAAWNGMMISALARGYQVLGESRYLDAAERAANFVLTEMIRNGLLLRTYRAADPAAKDGVSKLPAYLDDYAQMAAALVDLYEASFDLRWLEAADELARKMLADFWDPQDGAFFYTSAAHRDLVVRTKPFYDGAVPSGNATAALALLRLAKLLDRDEYREKAEAVLALAADSAIAQPRAHLDLLSAADFALRPTREIAIVGRRDDSRTRQFLKIIHGRFLPNKILALADPDDPAYEAAVERIPLLGDKQMIGGKTTAYVCEGFTCRQPVSESADLERVLEDSP